MNLCHNLSNYFFLVFFLYISISPETIHIVNLSSIYARVSLHLFFTCLNHLNLACRILSSTKTTHLISNILISIFFSPSMPTNLSQHSHFHNYRLLNMKFFYWPTLSLSFCCIFLSHKTLDASLQFIHHA